VDTSSEDFLTRSEQSTESNERFREVLRRHLGKGEEVKSKVREKGKLLVRERYVLPLSFYRRRGRTDEGGGVVGDTASTPSSTLFLLFLSCRRRRERRCMTGKSTAVASLLESDE